MDVGPNHINLSEALLVRLFPRAGGPVIAAFTSQRHQLAAAGVLQTIDHAASFLAHAGHESGGLEKLNENLSYSAERLVAVWPNRFRTVADAAPYARNPEGLANKVYGGRMGNIRAGDGWLFRGRGLFQLTGRDAYRAVGKLISLPLEANPSLAATAEGAVASAAGFWRWKGLQRTAPNDIEAQTRLINGGLNGLAERKSLFRLYREALAHA